MGTFDINQNVTLTDKQLKDELIKRGYFLQNTWHIEDVIGTALNQLHLELSKEEAIEVFEYMGNNFDAEIGVNWESIQVAIEACFPDKEKLY